MFLHANRTVLTQLSARSVIDMSVYIVHMDTCNVDQCMCWYYTLQQKLSPALHAIICLGLRQLF